MPIPKDEMIHVMKRYQEALSSRNEKEKKNIVKEIFGTPHYDELKIGSSSEVISSMQPPKKVDCFEQILTMDYIPPQFIPTPSTPSAEPTITLAKAQALLTDIKAQTFNSVMKVIEGFITELETEARQTHIFEGLRVERLAKVKAVKKLQERLNTDMDTILGPVAGGGSGGPLININAANPNDANLIAGQILISDGGGKTHWADPFSEQNS
jgi:hypothetical protein